MQLATRGIDPDDYCIEWDGGHGDGYAVSKGEYLHRVVMGL